MFVISALELRRNLGEIFAKVASGEEIIVQYRNNAKIKLSPYSVKKKTKVKTQVQKLFDYINSENYQKALQKITKDDILDENNPAQEKLNIKNLKAQKYL